MEVLRTLALVAAGGALGSAARWGASEWLRGSLGTRFPWATFL